MMNKVSVTYLLSTTPICHTGALLGACVAAAMVVAACAAACADGGSDQWCQTHRHLHGSMCRQQHKGASAASCWRAMAMAMFA